MIEKTIDEYAIKFLQWELPEGLCSDLCACDPHYKYRTGTNLMNFEQAKHMIKHILFDTVEIKD